MPSSCTAFEQTPIITVARLVAEWRTIFSPTCRPHWALAVEPVHTDPDAKPDDFPSELIVVVGKKNRGEITASPFALAALFEMTRFGHSIVRNSNFNKPRPQVYAKMAFRDAPEDLMSIRRILFDAGENEATKALWRENDYNPDNTYVEQDPHPRKKARTVALAHVERLVRERKVAGTLPTGFDIAAYLDNIADLFRWIDNAQRPENFHPSDPRRALAEQAGA